MHDANTPGTAVWIHRVLATVSRHIGAGCAADIVGLARCRNLSTRRPALSLDVYGGELGRFCAFDRDAVGRWGSMKHRVTREPSLT
ncbi:MAG: hypothetical protein V4566_05300 [Pseudomonadota bacterium]|jgi:hypothetical protein